MILNERDTAEGLLVSVCDRDCLGETYEDGQVSLKSTRSSTAAKRLPKTKSSIVSPAVGRQHRGDDAVNVAVEHGFVTNRRPRSGRDAPRTRVWSAAVATGSRLRQSLRTPIEGDVCIPVTTRCLSAVGASVPFVRRPVDIMDSCRTRRVGVAIDFDHFAVARVETGDWAALRRCLRNPKIVMFDQYEMFGPQDLWPLRRLLSHHLIGGVVVSVSGSFRAARAVTAVVLYAHILAISSGTTPA